MKTLISLLFLIIFSSPLIAETSVIRVVELERLQKKRLAKVVEIDKYYLKSLERLKLTLTRSGDLERALLVETEMVKVKSSIEDDLGYSAQLGKPVLAKVSSGRNKITAKLGAKVFTNRDYEFLEFPKEFTGWALDYDSAGRQVRELKLDVTEEGAVYLMCTEEDFIELVRDGWKKVAEARRQPVGGGDKFPIVISKVLEKGPHTVKTYSFLGGRLLTNPEE